MANKKKYSFYSQIRRGFVGFVLCGTLVGVAIGGYNSYKEHVVAESVFESTKAENDKVIAKQRRIAKDYQRLQDPDYVAGLARRDYYYSKPGELIFELDDTEQQTFYEQE